MLGVEDLAELESEVRSELNENLEAILSKLNRKGDLDKFLDLVGLSYLLKRENDYPVYSNGKIIVIGQSDVKEDILLAVGKELGISKNRFELYLEYYDSKKYDFRHVQWNSNYSVILVGPMGHSGVSKGDFGSVIEAISNQEGYPPVIKLGSNQGKLKITKSDFKSKLQELLKSGKLTAA